MGYKIESKPMTMIQLMEKQREVSRLAVNLAGTTRHKLQLARALVTDPEVLLIHKPLSFGAKEEAEGIMETLRAFVDERGIEHDPATTAHRRPRTCIITLDKPFHVEQLDDVLAVKDQKIVHLHG